MSEPTGTDPVDIRAELRLRPEPSRVTRLSRKVLIGLGGSASVAVMGAVLWALDGNRRDGNGPRELFTTDNRTTADGLQNLPRDYSGIPQLGPPLPGDLGRPIVRARERGRPVPAPGPMPVPGADPEEERRMAEMEAARTSRLFASTNARETPLQSLRDGIQPAMQLPELASAEPPVDPDSVQNMQDRKMAFVDAEADRRTVSPDRLAKPASPYLVQAGAVIPAALITGIRSDLPGQVTAQVTEHVYDSPTGTHLLIPQGAKLIGQYDSQVAFGQSRVLLVWNRLIMPNGTSIVLERQIGADTQGFSGLADEVDRHWGQLFKAAALSTLLGVGTELAGGDDESDIAKAIRESAQDSAGDIGQQIVRRQINIQPTLTIRPGFPVRVIVNRDLVLAPYAVTIKEPS